MANRNIPGEYLGYRSTRDAINKSRLKVTKMVFVVIITFALSWMPLYSIFCIVKFREDILYDDQGILYNCLTSSTFLSIFVCAFFFLQLERSCFSLYLWLNGKL